MIITFKERKSTVRPKWDKVKKAPDRNIFPHPVLDVLDNNPQNSTLALPIGYCGIYVHDYGTSAGGKLITTVTVMLASPS